MEAYLLIGAALLIVYLLAYIYAPDEKPERPRIPADLIGSDGKADDPFRSPQLMDRKLEQLGRFSMRYHQADGAWPRIPGWDVIRRWFR